MIFRDSKRSVKNATFLQIKKNITYNTFVIATVTIAANIYKIINFLFFPSYWNFVMTGQTTISLICIPLFKTNQRRNAQSWGICSM